MVDDNPANTVNDPDNTTANETELEAHEGIVALLQMLVMEV